MRGREREREREGERSIVPNDDEFHSRGVCAQTDVLYVLQVKGNTLLKERLSLDMSCRGVCICCL